MTPHFPKNTDFWLTLILLIMLYLVAFTGCAHMVYVPHGQAVRLRKQVDNHEVWVKTKDGDTVAGKMDIPNGWFCLPDPGE